MASTPTITAAFTRTEISRFNWGIPDICMTHRFFTRTPADDGRVMGLNLHCATRSLTTRKSPLASYFNKETPRGKVEAPKSRVREICGDPTRSLNNPYFGRNSTIFAKPGMVVVGRRPNRLERSAPRHTPSCLRELDKLGLRNLCAPTSWMPNYLN